MDENYLAAPEVILRPGSQYSGAARAFQGIPSMAVTPGGRLFATWYGGKTPGEDHNNYVVLVESRDEGRNWSSEILAVDPDGDGPVRAFDPQLWRDPDGALWLFWAQGKERTRQWCRNGVWAMVCRNPAADVLEWSAPRRLSDGVMMNKPLVLSNGEWLLPVSFWDRREAGSAAVVVSGDRGKSWRERGAADVPAPLRCHDEHMVVELNDGRLWMLVRTLGGIGGSHSSDGGATWSDLKVVIEHTNSRFFIRRLSSGSLLLVRHNSGLIGGEGEEKRLMRSHLTAFISRDDGANWEGGLLLDARLNVSYPDGDESADGVVNVVYDFERTGAREIWLARFSEAGVLSGGELAATARHLVSRAGGSV